MGFTMADKADRFLETVNMRACFFGDKVCAEKPALPLGVMQFELARHVDLVFNVECADGIVRAEWLEEMVKPDEPKVVVIFPHCHYQYDERKQEELRRRYPKVEWLFPDFRRDYFDNVWGHKENVEDAVQTFLDAGIIKVVA